MLVKAYPQYDEPRTLTVSQELLDLDAQRIGRLGLSRNALLFPPINRIDDHRHNRPHYSASPQEPACTGRVLHDPG